MEELLDSLLVWRDGELMSASSAISIDEARRSQEESQRLEGTRASSQARPEMELTAGLTGYPRRVQDLVTNPDRPRVFDTFDQPPASAQPSALRPRTLDGRVQHVTADRPSTSLGVHALDTLRPKLDRQGTRSRARRSSTSTPLRLIQAKTESSPEGFPSKAMDRRYRTDEVDMENAVPAHSLLLDGPPIAIQSMEDFEKANPYTPPPRKVIPRKAATKNGEYSGLFNMTCQDRGLKPEFSYREPAKGCFDVTLRIDGKVVDTVVEFASKKDAKEEVCRIGMSKIDSFPSNKKRSASSFEEDYSAPVPSDLHSEEWVNHVYEYTQQRKIDPPMFEETGLHPTHGPFKCILRFQGSPLTPFGADLGPFKKKSDAKRAAAQQATKWLRTQGLLAEAPSKRRRSANGSGIKADTMPGDTGLTQALAQDIKMESEPEQETVKERCNRLISELGLTALPTFEIEPLPGSFCNIQAVFNHNDAKFEPRLAGGVARVTHIFGKKEARRVCWIEVLKLLEEIKRDRQLS